MPVVASPNYYNPQMGQVAQNLGIALFGDPEARMKRDYYDSEVQKNQAGADKLDAEATFQLGRNLAQRNLQDTIAKGALTRQPNESQLQFMARTQGYLSALSGLATTAKDASEAVTGGLGSLYALDPTEQSAHTSLTLQGKPMGVNDYGTPEGQLAGQNREIAGKANVANIGARAEVQKQQIHEGAESDRFYAKPQNIGAGDTLAVPKKFQERSGLGPTLYGMPTESTAKGAAGTRISAGKASPGDTDLWSRASSGGQPLTVTQDELNKGELAALDRIPGAVNKDNPLHPYVVDDFVRRLDPAKRATAQAAYSSVFQATRNAQAAQEAYYAALGMAPGSSYSEPSLMNEGGIKLPQGQGQQPQQPAAGPPTGKVPMLNGERIFPSPDGSGWVYRDGRPAQ
jgi:hypothetical protein